MKLYSNNNAILIHRLPHLWIVLGVILSLLLAGCSPPAATPVTTTLIPITGSPSVVTNPNPIVDYPSQCPPTPSIEEKPGLLIKGFVYSADGAGLPGAKIYLALGPYNPDLAATTDDKGCYQINFRSIPGDEMMTVKAELTEYTLVPADKNLAVNGNIYYWRHYYGFETQVLNFVVQ
jgi:hypothetical protein